MSKELDDTYSLIWTLTENYRKDSAHRKTQKYLDDRHDKLQNLWTQYNQIANALPEDNFIINHQKTTERIYRKTLENIISLKDEISAKSTKTGAEEDPELQNNSTSASESNPENNFNTSASNSENNRNSNKQIEEVNSTNFNSKTEENQEENVESKYAIMSLNIDNFLKIIPMFDGKSTEVHRFLSCCQVVYTPLNNAETKKQFIELLKARTTGRAYDILRYKNFTDFETLSKEFQKQFLPKKSLGQLQIQLISARQFHTETVCEFANRIEQFLSDINSVSQTETNEVAETILQFNQQIALTAFQEGLKEPIKTIVKASRFKELNAAISFASSEDTASPNKSQFQKKSFNCNSCGKPGHFSKDCRVKFCEFCKKSGHVSRDCRNKTSNKTTGKVNHIEIECRYCKKKGHVIENCRKRSYNNAQSQNNSTRSENQPERDSTSQETPAHNLQ